MAGTYNSDKSSDQTRISTIDRLSRAGGGGIGGRVGGGGVGGIGIGGFVMTTVSRDGSNQSKSEKDDAFGVHFRGSFLEEVSQGKELLLPRGNGKKGECFNSPKKRVQRCEVTNGLF